MDLVASSHRLFTYLILFCLDLCVALSLPSACDLQLQTAVEDYEYYQPGDFIIGGIFAVNFNMDEFLTKEDEKMMYCNGPLISNYKYFLDFLFVIEEINKNPNILPNVTLGYHVYDSCSNANKAVKSVIQILSGPGGDPVPNYHCTGEDNIAGYIGDLLSVTTLPIAQILNVYGYTQISYGATDQLLGDRTMYPYLFRTARSDHVYFSAVVQLLKHFSWDWVGIITSADDSGDRESLTLSSFLNSHGVCIEFIVAFFSHNSFFNTLSNRSKKLVIVKNMEIISSSSSRIILICGTVSPLVLDILQLPDDVLNTKTFIFPPSWFANTEILEQMSTALNCSLGFLLNMEPDIVYDSNKEVLQNPYDTGHMQRFIKNIHPSKSPDDMLLEEIWMIGFKCLSPNKYKNKAFEILYKEKLHECSGKENLTWMPYVLLNIGSPVVYKAVMAMVYALDAILVNLGTKIFEKGKTNSKYKHKLKRYLEEFQYKVGSEERSYFDDKGELNTIYILYNWVKMSRTSFKFTPVGSITPWAKPDQQLSISHNDVTWKNNEVPRSQCSKNCPPGSRKIKNNWKPICCYDCVVCSDGEISNTTDSEDCWKCLDSEWSNSNRDQCLPKLEDYLSLYDGLSIALSSIAVILWTTSILILGIFVSHSNTPIVKANNQNLSFLLLISLSLCFLCVFLFIGRPDDTTCKLRHMIFGIIFSISVSSVLAKTIMVYMAFKISRPGSPWKKLIGVNMSSSIVVMASSIEVVISSVWLYFSPPYLEQDTRSYQRKVVIQCNEGSQVAFFAVLGYLFLLAAVSCGVAYLARTLPDRFNEAKYITFSMLIFCSVWITMVPSYLSSKGKNMVAVEIFSILSSSAGLLGFIFFPKCYIILLKPQMNTRRNCGTLQI